MKRSDSFKWRLVEELRQRKRPITSLGLARVFPGVPRSTISSCLSTFSSQGVVQVDKSVIPFKFWIDSENIEHPSGQWKSGNNGITIDDVFNHVERKNAEARRLRELSEALSKENEELKKQLSQIKTMIAQGRRDFGGLLEQ